MLKQLLDDAKHHKALMDSKRIFQRVDLFELQIATKSERLKRFAEIIKLVRDHVKVLHVVGVHLHMDLLILFASLSHLESIHLIEVETPPIQEDFILNLHNLREVEIRAHDSFNTSMLFKNLPPGILHSAHVMSFIGHESKSKPFANQHNIRSLVVNEHSARHFHFENLKLESIEAIGPIKLAEVLKHQVELKALKAAIHSGDMETVLTHAKSLHELKIVSVGNHPSENDFKALARFPKLVRLELIYHPSCDGQFVNDSIGWPTSATVRELNVFCHHPLSKHALAEVGRDLPGLDHLTLFSHSSINGINIVLQNHSKLKFLSWKSNSRPDPRPDFYYYQDGLHQKALEELVLEQPIDAHKDLPRLIHNLTNLKSFRHRSFDNVIQGVLEARPDVKISLV